MSNKKFPNAPVVDSVQSHTPEKLVVELEAEIIEGRRAFLVLADSLAQYRHLTRQIAHVPNSGLSLSDKQELLLTFQELLDGLNQWSDGFFERFSETGFIVDDNGHLAHESQTPSLFPDEASSKAPADPVHSAVQDPYIIGG